MGKRRIFISYQHLDRNQAKGFRLLEWNKNVPFDFVGRHLLDPVNSKNESYIKSCIDQQLAGTSVTVVLLGESSHQSGWIAHEVTKSLEKGNGVVAIRLKGHDSAPVPQVLRDCGAEVLQWDPSAFEAAIERAAEQARRTSAVAKISPGAGDCAR